MVELLRHRAAVQPDDRAYIALSDRGREETVISFAGLERRYQQYLKTLAQQYTPPKY